MTARTLTRFAFASSPSRHLRTCFCSSMSFLIFNQFSTHCETHTVCLFSILFSRSFDEFDIAPA